jgi:hypothetical protein
MTSLISTGCHCPLPLRHYLSSFFVGVLKIAQLATVHAKEMACPVQNLASAGMHVRILTTTCRRTGLRTVKRTENSEIVLKRANYHSKYDKYSP